MTKSDAILKTLAEIAVKGYGHYDNVHFADSIQLNDDSVVRFIKCDDIIIFNYNNCWYRIGEYVFFKTINEINK